MRLRAHLFCSEDHIQFQNEKVKIAEGLVENKGERNANANELSKREIQFVLNNYQQKCKEYVAAINM